MSSGDFIKIVQEIRGTGANGVAPTDGIYYDLTIALTGANSAPGKYGHIVEMYNDLNGPSGSYTDFITKYGDFLTKYSDVLVQAGLATDAASASGLAEVAAKNYRDQSEVFATNASNASAHVDTRLGTVQANGSTCYKSGSS